MSKALSEIFDVDHVPAYAAENTTIVPVNNITVSENDTAVDNDIQLAQNNLKDLMKLTTDALREAMNVAIQSESPRAFEVVTGMVNASADLSTKLIDSHQTKQRIKKESKGQAAPGTPQGNITNNNLFVGTPAELTKLLRGQNGTI